MLQLRVPADVEKVVDTLLDAKHDAYVVGGSVRDALRGGKPGELIDPHRGRQDLEARVLRAVGDPDERFKEDALRMLRAIRFATLLELRIERETAAAIRRNAQLTATLSGERIQQEIVKILGA